jgi:putative MATE family efflux protein
MLDREALLTAPVPRTLAALAWPVLVVLAVQTLVGVAETWFVSRLGTSAVAGVALVFPLFMLMTMMSNGGIGGGVSSAIARALGGGNKADADALVVHGLVIAFVFGALFSIGAWLGGPHLYRWLGASDDTLANALLYSNVTFGAAIPAWITNVLASTLRGAGNVTVPARISIIGAACTLLLSPLLIFGWGRIPGFGVAGAGMAMILFNTAAAGLLWMYLQSGLAPVRLHRARIEWRLFKMILRVGLLSAIGTIVANLTVVITTGFVGTFGRDAIAGYGLASRLDYLLIPLLFAIGTASVTMVGTNIGAGRIERARHIAWTAAGASMLITGAIGLAAAVFPGGWMHFFSDEEEVVHVGTDYLRRVAPFYTFTGLGMALYFASQGAGRVVWPFGVGVVRLAIVVVAASYWINAVHGSHTGLFWIVAVSQLVFGGLNALGMATGWSWGVKETHPAAAITAIGQGPMHREEIGFRPSAAPAAAGMTQEPALESQAGVTREPALESRPPE